MKTLSRKDVIEVLVQNELDYWYGLLYDGEVEYLKEIIRDGGFVGFSTLTNYQLEEEYKTLFDEDVRIAIT